MKVKNSEMDKTYNLDELLELQNKLMLMSSKGEHGKEQVNKFMEVSLPEYLNDILMDR